MRIFTEHKKRLLSEISVQCSAAQECIAKRFDEPGGKELLAVLLKLKELLDRFMNDQPES